MDENQIKTLIAQEVGKQFSNKMVGDTPNDALQLIPRKYIDGKFFAGRVNANGTSIFLPTGWTSQVANTSEYTITHNLGTTNYAFVVLADSVASFAGNTGPVLVTIDVTSPQANSFSFATFRWDTGQAIAAPFLFILTKK